MSEVVKVDFKGTGAIRSMDTNGKLEFVSPDVCRCLGMDMTDGTYQWLKGLASDEKRLVWRKDLPELFSGSRAPSLTLISESGLYKLALRSNKPEAREFQDWVTREVLPAIRKDGMYVMGEEKLKTGEMSDDEFILAAMEKLQTKGSLYRGLGVRRRAARSGFNWNASKICRPTSCWVVEPASFCVCT